MEIEELIHNEKEMKKIIRKSNEDQKKIMDNMTHNELHIISKYNNNIKLQLLKGEVSLLWDEEEDKLAMDNEEYIYAIYKILKKADELGGFDKIKEEKDELEEICEEIYV